MKKDFELIKDWRTQFGLPVRDSLTISTNRETRLALSLIEEELMEFSESVNAGDISDPDFTIDLDEVADAIGDLFFVVTQAACIFGFDSSELIQKVYDSNMSKLCPTIEIARNTVEAYKQKGINTYMTLAPDQKNWVIRHEDTHKVLKSLTFEAPKWEYQKEYLKSQQNTL